MSERVRQLHRWLSAAFMAAVVLNLVALGREWRAVWIGLVALFPLILLMFTGAYLFVLPYVAKHRSRRNVE